MHALRQHVVRRSEALPVVEHARQRVVALAHLHQLVEAHVPAGDRVDVVDHRLELEPVQRRADEVAHPDRVVGAPDLLRLEERAHLLGVERHRIERLDQSEHPERMALRMEARVQRIVRRLHVVGAGG